MHTRRQANIQMGFNYDTICLPYHMTVGVSHDCPHLIGSDRIMSLMPRNSTNFRQTYRFYIRLGTRLLQQLVACDVIIIIMASTRTVDIAGCIHFSYTELREATNDFNSNPVHRGGCKIGEGGFGPVFKGKLKCTNVAIKVLNAAAIPKVNWNNGIMCQY